MEGRTIPTSPEFAALSLVSEFSFVPPNIGTDHPLIQSIKNKGWIELKGNEVSVTNDGFEMLKYVHETIYDPAGRAAVQNAFEQGIITDRPHWKNRPWYSPTGVDPNEALFQTIFTQAGMSALSKACEEQGKSNAV